MSPIRILIADDSPTVRTGLKLLLQFHDDWTVCGEADNGHDAVKKAAQLQPDVILLDISMPAMDGLSAAELIRRDSPNAEILIVTHFESSTSPATPRKPASAPTSPNPASRPTSKKP